MDINGMLELNKIKLQEAHKFISTVIKLESSSAALKC